MMQDETPYGMNTPSRYNENSVKWKKKENMHYLLKTNKWIYFTTNVFTSKLKLEHNDKNILMLEFSNILHIM